MSGVSPAKHSYRCPVCRKPAEKFQGFGVIGEYLDIDNDKASFWRDADDFRPKYVMAVCVCGHAWRLRGVIDVAGVRERLGLTEG